MSWVAENGVGNSLPFQDREDNRDLLHFLRRLLVALAVLIAEGAPCGLGLVSGARAGLA